MIFRTLNQDRKNTEDILFKEKTGKFIGRYGTERLGHTMKTA